MREYGDIVKEVAAKYACDHHDTQRCNKPDKNGRPMIVTQCVKCGERVGAFIPVKTLSSEEVARLPIFDSALAQNYAERKFAEMNALWDAEKKKKDAAWWAAYEAHLATPKWKALSRKVILRAQGVCEGCRARPATQAHHLTYQRMGDEMLFDLVAVCDACHKKIHPEEAENEDEGCPF